MKYLNPQLRTFVEWLSAIALHTATTVTFTFPFSLLLRSHVGEVGGDKFQFIWNFWWVKYALLQLHQLPFYCEFQYYPTGVSLALHEVSYFWALLSIPCQWFLEPVVVFNIFLVLCFPLNGLAFYRAAKEIVGHHWGALAGSVVFAYCPYLIGRFQVSHLLYLSVFFIPLFILELVRYHRNARSSSVIKAGIYFSLTGLISYYYVVGLVLILLISVILYLLKTRSDWSSSYWTRLLCHSGTMAFIILILLGPVITPVMWQLRRGDYQSLPRSYQHVEANNGDLLAYFIPSPSLARWIGWNFCQPCDQWARGVYGSFAGNRLEKVMYPGWLSWLVLVSVLMSRTLWLRTRAWWVLALGAGIFSLGPTLFIHGQPYWHGVLPFRLLLELPIFSILRGSTRYAFLINLGTGMLTAASVNHLEKLSTPRMGKGVALIAIVITLGEFWPQPARYTALSRFSSPFYESLAQDPRSCTILNIPVDFAGASGGAEEYLFAQTIHQKPIVGGYVSREPIYVFSPLKESAFLQAVQHRRYEKDQHFQLTDAALADARTTLSKLHVCYVVLHKTILQQEEWERVIPWIERILRSPSYEDASIRVYRVA